MLDIAASEQQQQQQQQQQHQLTATGRRAIAGIKNSSDSTASHRPASRTLQHSTTSTAPKSRLAFAVASPARIISNGATSENRLKLSTITRVPSAKSRLKQPVASLCSSPLSPTISNGRSSTTSESHSSGSHENHSPHKIVPISETSQVSKRTSSSQSAQSLSTRDNGANQRSKNSMPTVNSRSRLIAPTTRTTTSVLPRLVKKPLSSNNEISSPSSTLSSRQSSVTPNASTTKSARLSSLRKQPAAVASPKTPVAKVPTSHLATKVTSSSSKYAIKSNNATTRGSGAASKASPCGRSTSSNLSASDQQEQPPTSNKRSENCLGGRLNNLVAVVHPQQQQYDGPNDDELMAAGRAKQLLGKQQEQECSSNIATTATTTNSTVQQQRDSEDVVRAERERSKGGIVNLNHKDVNGATAGCEEETTTTTTARRNENGLSSSLPVNDLGNHRENEEAPPQPLRGKEEARSTTGDDHEVEDASCESKQDGTAAAGSDTTIKQRLMGSTTSGQDVASSSPADNLANKKTRALNCSPASDHAFGNTLVAPSSSLLAHSSCSSLSGNKFDVANLLSFEKAKNSNGDGGSQQIASDKFQTTCATATETSHNHNGSQRNHAAGHDHHPQAQTNICSRSHNSSPSISNGIEGMPATLPSSGGNCYKSGDHDEQPRGINLQQPRTRSSALKPPRETKQTGDGSSLAPARASHLSYVKSGNKNDRQLATKPPLSQSSLSTVKVTCSSSAHKHVVEHDHHNHRSINDRLLRKPMGQQVLSLMMLDAGLLPATNNQQTPSEQDSKSHVCLQSEPVEQVAHSHSERRLEFLSSSPRHHGHCNSDVYDGNNNDASDLTSDNNERTTAFKSNVHSLDSARTELMASNRAAKYEERLKQIRSATAAWTVNHDFSCATTSGVTSISLPSSPRVERTSRLARFRHHAQTDISGQRFQSQQKLECALQDKLYHLGMASHPFNGSSRSYQRATAQWLSPVIGGTASSSQSPPPQRYGSPARSSPGATFPKSSNLYCDTTNQTLETHSLASSSCSSLTNNHCPPVLALSNQLDAREFHEMIKANVDESVRRMKQEQQEQQRNGLGGVCISTNESSSASEFGQVQFTNGTTKLKPDTQVGQSLGKQWGPLSGDWACEQDNLSTKIDRLSGTSDGAAGSTRVQQQRSASVLNCESEQKKSRNNIGSIVETNKEDHSASASRDLPASSAAETQHFELLSRRQQQPRSNSIGGQEFHHFNGAEHHQQRLKQSLIAQSHLQQLQQQQHQQNPYIDPSQYYNRRQLGFNSNLTSNQQYQTGLPADPRSISPSYSLAGGRPTDIYLPKRSASIKYPLDRQHRNNLHASLECLNTTYSEYGQSPNQKQQHLSAAYHLARQQHYAAHQQMQQQQQHQHPPIQNQHYATSYMMAAAPAETMVNQNGGQDLAAADMGAPPMQLQQQQPQHHYPVISSASNGTNTHQQPTNHQIQNLFNSRPSLQMSQSPLHRRMTGVGMQANQITATSSANPMRAGHSSLSLASSTYLIEDKLQSEIKQLASELKSEKEKNDALNNQLTINSSLMAAFEQSLTTLNSRLRQMTTINERKDQEIDELRNQLSEKSNCLTVDRPNSEKSTSPMFGGGLSVTKLEERENNTLLQVVDTNNDENHTSRRQSPVITSSPVEGDHQEQKSEKDLLKVIENLKRQLVVKERLLTETRLEALSTASKLEELESRLNGEHSLLVNEDDLDEGVMVANHSPSDSDAITDSAHFSEMNSHVSKSSNTNNINNNNNYHSQQTANSKHPSQRNSNNLEDMILFTPTHSIHSNSQSASNNDSQHHVANNTSSRLSNNSTDDTNEMIHLHRQLQQQHDNQSNHSSSDYHVEEDKSPGDTSTVNQQQREFNSRDQQQEASRAESRGNSDTINKLLSGLLVDN